jgi:Bacterial pre-peptidase C-terminal domain.
MLTGSNSSATAILFNGIDGTIKAPENGTYYIEVAGQEQQTTSNYTLNLDIVTPAENDQFAPNDDFESAAPINQEFNDARVVGGESDFYKITLNQTETVSAELRTADQLSSLSIRLYNPQLTQVTSDGNDFQGIAVTHTATEPGSYYIEVAGQGQQTTSNYELQTNQTFIPEDATDMTDGDPVAEYAGEDGEVGAFDVLDATEDFRSGQLGPFEVLEIIQAFRN